MSDANLSALDALISKLRRTRAFIVQAAPAAAEAMAVELRATAAAGTTPEGAAWAPRKKDGARALVGAAASIAVRAVGSVLLARLDFIHSIHNNGPQGRKILPSGGLPPSVAAAIKRSLVASWEAA